MFDTVKNIIRPLIPAGLLKRYRIRNLRPLIAEIANLNVAQTGFDKDGTPWVKLQSGVVFYGLPPTDDESFIYSIIKDKIDNGLISHDCFGVIYEIISRYNAPRSLPGELVTYPSEFDAMRDPINDFSLSEQESKTITDRFHPRDGDIIVDIGACHGFGTLKLAQYVGKSGKVIAIEANPISAEIIRKNIKANKADNIILLEMAVSNYTKADGRFFIDGVATGNSLRPDVLEELGIHDLSEMLTAIDTGDNILKGLGINKINYLNVTVNGGEPEVIIGLEHTIKQSDRLAVTMPGWYYRDGERLDNLLASQLTALGFDHVKTGRLGRVIAWRS